MDVTITKLLSKAVVELHTQLAQHWWADVMDSDYIRLGDNVYLVDQELGAAGPMSPMNVSLERSYRPEPQRSSGEREPPYASAP